MLPIPALFWAFTLILYVIEEFNPKIVAFVFDGSLLESYPSLKDPCKPSSIKTTYPVITEFAGATGYVHYTEQESLEESTKDKEGAKGVLIAHMRVGIDFF